jgi:hypothetical protein
MRSKSWSSRLGAPLVAFALTVAPSVSPVHGVEDARKVSVVSFALSAIKACLEARRPAQHRS